jgi:hypothetical protein
MSPSSDTRIPRIGAFGKAKPLWKTPSKRRMAADRPKPLLRQGMCTNCSPCGRISPVTWLELMTRERLTPWAPRVAVAAPRSSAECLRTGLVYGDLRHLERDIAAMAHDLRADLDQAS